MKQALFQGLTMLLIYSVTSIFLFYSTRDYKGKSNTMKLHLLSLVIGVIGTVSFLTVAIVIALLSDDPKSWILLFFSILSIPLIIAYFQCRIFYDDEKLIIRNFFGKKKIIFYYEITDIKNGIDTRIFTKETSVNIPNYLSGRFEFLLTLAPHLSKKTGKSAQKAAENPPVRPFRESVWRYKEFYFAYILIYILLIGLFIFSLNISNGEPGIWFSIVGAVVWTLMVFISVHSAKRAHSSAFWRRIARHCFKEGYLEE